MLSYCRLPPSVILTTLCFLSSGVLLVGFGNGQTSTFVHGSTGTHTLFNDRLLCSSRGVLATAFCREELQGARRSIREESVSHRQLCLWNSLGRSSHLSEMQAAILNESAYSDEMPAWSAFTPHGYESQLKIRPAPPEESDAPMSIGDLFGQMYPVELQRCESRLRVTTSSQRSSFWTFDRMGPFDGKGGYGWYSAGWPDCGGFSNHLLDGKTWITAFGFAPTAADGRPFGMPPLHIHHMHVSASQSLARFFAGKGRLPMFDDHAMSDPLLGAATPIEFDVHGDRQCQVFRGGTDCLIRNFPPGYGLHVTRSFHTFYDVNDVRSSNAPGLTFYTEHAFKWTHTPCRHVRHYATIIPSNIPFIAQNTTLPGLSFPWHDDYLLHFSGFRTDYIAWSEQKFMFSGTLAHTYWHSHHDYTVDSWVISATAQTLGLRNRSFDPYVNISASNRDVYGVMAFVMNRLDAAQQACLDHSCMPEPRLRCWLNKDRWDLIDGKRQERYHDPVCDSWSVSVGDPFTLISFHTQLNGLMSEKIWMHTVFYGLIA